ncbi:MAG: site-specific tyrosine recombinase [Candidatus Cryptobacteroides sp.]|nr:tyrosine recombinase XerD [Bacteroidales bacterium]MDY6157791.1 site-specific tyrosine recombinase [Candidatus Cryptobacteroides sp.]
MNNALKAILKDFSFYLKVERRLSANTAAAYTGDVEGFFSACSLMPGEVCKEDIREHIAARAGKISKRSQARLLSSLKAFFDWCIVEGERKDNPCDAVDFPKLGQYLPEVLSVEEVEAIMDSVDLRSPSGVRDRAILELLYGCGLRVSELCGLRISHVYLNEGFVRVVGKGDKERLVPLGEPAADAFRAWLDIRPEPAEAAYQDSAFLNLRGTPLSRVSVFKMIKKQALLAGVDKEISPHSFRHSFATHLIAGGADLRIVQEMLGHESILTTEIYTHIDSRTWQASVLEHHPCKD